MTNIEITHLFADKPSQWGLRGDPYLWQELQASLQSQPMPPNVEEFAALLTNTIESIVGVPLDHPHFVRIERFAHGGMSSGVVCLEFWRDKGIPLLVQRYLQFINNS